MTGEQIVRRLAAVMIIDVVGYARLKTRRMEPGGLFAVIALNFTVNATYQVLGSGDNPVSRLFALNYVTLGIRLINVLLFRFNVGGRWLGRYVQEQLYPFLIWAVPQLMLVSAAGDSRRHGLGRP